MKKAFYGAFVVLLLGGAGIGFWLLRQGEEPVSQLQSSEQAEVEIPASNKSLNEVLTGLTEHKEFVDLVIPVLPGADTSSSTIIFIPTVAARQAFVTDTALSLSKFSSYHIVISDTELAIIEGTKLKTKHGQELLVVKKDNQLYVRDAKGNDSRLRKPLVASDGKIYYIDNVLLTQ